MHRSARAPRRALSAFAVCLFLCTSCSEADRRNSLSSVRLSPTDVSSEAAEAVDLLVDRDTTRSLTLTGPTPVKLRFARPMELRRVKVHAAPGVRVVGAGLELEAGAGWTGVDLPTPVTTSELSLVLTPAPGAASVSEIEVWGAGTARAPRDVTALALASKSRSTTFDDAVVLRSSPSELTLSPPGAASGEPCATATLPQTDPRQARRAYLVYEAELPRSVALQRSLNGGVPQGGFWVGSVDGPATLVDELNPEALEPENRIQLCLPLEAGSAVTVRDLRIVLALDSGLMPADRETSSRAASLVDGDPSTSLQVSAGALTVRLDRPIHVDRAEVRVETDAQLEGFDVFDGDAWQSRPGTALTAADGELPLEGQELQALRLTFARGARVDRPAALVSDVAVTGSGVGPRAGAARIVITYPPVRLDGDREIGERFADRAYVAGWAESPAGRGTVEVDGARVDTAGEFALPLSRPADATGAWPVVVRARFPDGSEVERTIHLDEDRGASATPGAAAPLFASGDERYGREDRETRGNVDREKGGRVTLGTEVAVEVPPGAVDGATALGITRKGHESVPLLDAGMVNVTAPAYGAYRFLPKGQRFAKPVKVTLPFDPSRLPEGVGPEQIKTYFFDEAQERWVALPRAALDAGARRVVSETTHFTFMINAVLVLPDHPGPVSFDPNSIKDLKAADPSAGIDLIATPEANAQGTAQLAFPFRLPPARGAYQPDLRLTYDSSSGNGWVGIGWDLPVSSIQIDTRFGVAPAAVEPRYVLDGAQLVPTGESARCEGTTEQGSLYRERIARTFARIVRCGAAGTAPWFEVRDRTGTLFVYGHSPEARLASPRSGETRIGAWHLERVVDLNGNLTVFEYTFDDEHASGSDRVVHAEPFRQSYLRSIRYSGTASADGTGAVNGGTPGPYSVELSSRPGALRTDPVTSARYGFKAVTRRLLGNVTVSRNGLPIRQYELSYELGTFSKSRLKKIAVYGYESGARRFFDEHTFEYETPDLSSPFGETTVPWEFDDADRAQLGETNEHSKSKQGGLGVSVMGFSLGGNKGKSKSDSVTAVMLADVNGDGLPDRLVGGSGGARAAFNTGLGADGRGRFSRTLPRGDPDAENDPGPLPVGLGTEHGKAKVTNYRAGVFGVGASKGKSSFTSKQTSALQDADGDGYLDWITGTAVLRGRHRDALSRAIGFEAWPGPPLVTGTEGSLFSIIGDEIVEDLEEQRGPSDAVLEWIAPYAGDVDVTGWLSLTDVDRPKQEPGWDGVRLRIYRADEAAGEFVTEQLLEVATDVSGVADPVPVALEYLRVEPGTRLYFVLSTLSDFPVELATRSPIEEAQFSPRIVYRDVPAEDREHLDPTGAKAFVFDAQEDFRLAGAGAQSVIAPVAGRVRVLSTVVKSPSTSNVRYCVQRFYAGALELDEPCGGDGAETVAVRAYAGADERTEPWDLELDVGAGDQLVFRIESNLSMDPADVAWLIDGRYIEVIDDEGARHAPHPSMARQASFVADPFVPVHVSLDASTPEVGRWSALPDGIPLEPLVVPESGELEIVTRQASLVAPEVPVWLAARTHDILLFEQAATDAPRTIRVAVTAGDRIFFEAHAERGFSVQWAPNITLFPSGGGVTRALVPGIEVPLNFTRDAIADDDGNVHVIRSPFGGGFHGWRYGAWHGENDETFDPNGMIALLPYIMNRLWPELAALLDDPHSAESRAFAATSPLFPKRLGTQSGLSGGLRPGVPAFVSMKERMTFITAGSMHAARENVFAENVDGLAIQTLFGERGTLRSTSGSNELNGFDLFGWAGVNRTTGKSGQNGDLVDLNGDRLLDRVALRLEGDFPDFEIVQEVSLTGLDDLVAGDPIRFQEQPILRRNRDLGGTANIGKTMAFAKLPSDNATIQAVVGSATGGFGAALGVNVSSTDNELVDMNADGLPDLIERTSDCANPGGCFAVRLNLGDARFGKADLYPVDAWRGEDVDLLWDILDADRKLYGSNRLRRTTATSLKSSVGVQLVLGVSKAWESSIAQTQVQLVDLTGDGLPDYVRKGPGDGGVLRVMVNTGAGFLPEQDWHMPGWPAGVTQPFLSREGLWGGAFGLFEAATRGIPRIDAVEATGSWSPQGSTGWSVGGTVSAGIVSISGSYGEEESDRVSGLQLGMLDIDGDGLADHVLKAEERDDGTTNVKVHARMNRLGKANLLTRVNRPLRGKIDLFYARAGNTVAMPETRWVLSEVVVRDGHGTNDRPRAILGHDIRTRWTYEDGRQDRVEREFLGFGKVVRENADGSFLVREFANERYASRGLLKSERVENAARVALVETVNEYRDPYAEPEFRRPGPAGCEERRPFMMSDEDYFCGSLFPALHVARQRFYEEQPVARVQTRQVFTYDRHGNVTGFDDFGDEAVTVPEDDVHATITYWTDELASTMHSVSRVKELIAKDGGGRTLRRREGEYEEKRGNLKRLISWIDGSRYADTILIWDELGRLEELQGPLVKGDRYTVTYGYDNVVHTFRRTATDSFGYTSTTDWNYELGEPTITVDVNGQVTRREYDAFGRLTDLFAPTDPANAAVHVDYGHRATVPWARSQHRLPEGGTLDTVVFADGLGRVLQSRKTAEVEGRGIGWTVSGQVVFDRMGRLAKQGQAYFEAGDGLTYRATRPLHPKRFVYDALGRTIRSEEPIEPTKRHTDGLAVTSVSYGFGELVPGVTRRAATATDPERKVRVVFRDPADRVVAVEERDKGVPFTTTYRYDGVGQLNRITDTLGHLTALGYDQLGQRTSVDSPDAGLVEFRFDLAGNLEEKIDAGLRAAGQSIRYEWVHNQLRMIDYPESPDVVYEYGVPGAKENGAARVTRVVDDAGEETRGYGPLGELVRTTRTVRPFRPGDIDKVFETRFDFDVFGRMRSIVYPDGETVTYGYDAGGLLRSASARRKTVSRWLVEKETYVSSITYDEFGQRRTLTLGNGAVTTHDYYPESRRLAAVSTTAAGREIQKLAYEYDRVGNVLALANALTAASGNRSGPTNLAYGYDDLYRLTSSTGTAESRPGVVDSFSASYSYDAIHNMTRNTQVHVVRTSGLPGEGTGRPPATNHDFGYEYDPSKPHQATVIGDRRLTYDLNGNTERECVGDAGCGTNASHLRRYYWTEENRLAAVIDGGGANATRFVYDAAGERVAKLGRGGESLTVGQFFALKGRKAAAKHVFAGSTRIATKLSAPSGWQPPTPTAVVAAAGEPATGADIPGCIPSDYRPAKCPAYPGGDSEVVGPPEATIRPATYYYHPDHLGSTSWVTDQNGRVHEHVEYFPYGQVWRDARADADAQEPRAQRFLFTGKELDEETGLYYFGARYYDPVRVRWTSADPEWLTQGPVGLNPYQYAGWDPTGNVDPDGRSIWTKLAKLGKFLYKGGDLAGTFADTAEDLATIANPASTPLEKGIAIASLASEAAPIRVSDVKDGWRIAKAAGKAIEDARSGLRKVDDVVPDGAGRAGRGGTRLKPDPIADGPHTTFKRDPQTGSVTGHAEWDAQGHPTKRTDVTGSAHGPVATPHTHEYGPPNVNRETGMSYPGNEVRVRPASPDEIPK
jgi:RHS repeat-associated protein